jgi:hypothetical protein
MMSVYETNDMTTDDLTVFKQWLKGILLVQPVTVTFVKKDGTERVMNCTLQPDLLPAVELKEDKEPRKINDNVMAVYDLDSKGWRSFIPSSVKRVEFDIDGE